MASATSRVLVIDVSIARSAGASENDVSSATRLFLESVLEICHRMAVTAPILEEWRRHQSRFTRRWRLSMYAKKKIVTVQNEDDHEFTERILASSPRVEDKRSMLKDIPLIVASLRADGIIVSRDEAARAVFQIRELGAIMWINLVLEPQFESGWSRALLRWRNGSSGSTSGGNNAHRQ